MRLALCLLRKTQNDAIVPTVNPPTVRSMTLPDSTPTRKQRFNAALSLAGMTQEYWRTAVHPVSAHHLHQVLDGERGGSAELNAAIDAVIAKYLTADYAA